MPQARALTPETKYAKSGDVHIAYQVIGDGPVDLVFVPGWITHVELSWDEPLEAAFRRRLAGFSRLILFDKRGTGLSDRVPVDQLPILEERMDDVRAVMDAVGSERAALMGVSEGGAMSALFAATYPERTAALILYGSFAQAGAALLSQDELDARLRALERELARRDRPQRPRAERSPATTSYRGAGARSCATLRARALRSRCCG